MAPANDDAKVSAREALGGCSNAIDDVCAVVSRETSLLMTVQQAAFTVHRSKQGHEEWDPARDCLIGLEIAGDLRNKLFELLRRVGVTRSGVFSALDNLAKDIVDYEVEPADSILPR